MNVHINFDESLETNEVRQFAAESVECIALYARKNHDYGNSFSEGFAKLGKPYAVGRLLDKMNRLIALCGKEETAQVKDETWEDTLRDLANYSLMTLCEMHKI